MICIYTYARGLKLDIQYIIIKHTLSVAIEYLGCTVPFEIVSAGLHCDRNISRQILPFEFILGWYILVVNAIWEGVDKKGQRGKKREGEKKKGEGRGRVYRNRK